MLLFFRYTLSTSKSSGTTSGMRRHLMNVNGPHQFPDGGPAEKKNVSGTWVSGFGSKNPKKDIILVRIINSYYPVSKLYS